MNPIDSEPSVMAPQDETPEIREEAAQAPPTEPQCETESEPDAEPVPETETPPPAEELKSAPEVSGESIPEPPQSEEISEVETVEILADSFQLVSPESALPPVDDTDHWKAILEAIIYVSDEPLSASQIANALHQPVDRVTRLLSELMTDYAETRHGIVIREVANGYKMGTKPEHHEAIRTFVRNLKPPLKLSMAALETLAVIAYKQPITAPEILDIRGVQGGGVLKTLLDRKLITTAGRKNVVGKPILYRTTKEFLIQFGLKDISELPTLKEFEELRRLALSEPELEPEPQATAQAELALEKVEAHDA